MYNDKKLYLVRLSSDKVWEVNSGLLVNRMRTDVDVVPYEGNERLLGTFKDVPHDVMELYKRIEILEQEKQN